MAGTVAPGGVAAEWVASMLTPTANCPGDRQDRSSRALAISIRAIIRAVANTAGKASPASSGNALARSPAVTTRSAVAVESRAGSVIGSRSEGVACGRRW